MFDFDTLSRKLAAFRSLSGMDPDEFTALAALAAGRQGEDEQVRRFCRTLAAVYPALWTFARVDGVEPTNNHAERTLRLAVIWRKLCFGSHSDGGCRFAERILTVVQTLRLQVRPRRLAARTPVEPAPPAAQCGYGNPSSVRLGSGPDHYCPAFCLTQSQLAAGLARAEREAELARARLQHRTACKELPA